jgi:hypothetical protein
MTFSFTEYVESQDVFRVTGTMETYFQDDEFFAELRASHDDLVAFCRSLSAMSPRAETAIGRFLPADMVVAA